MLYLQIKQMNKIGQNQHCLSDCKSKRIVRIRAWAASSRGRVIRTQTVKRSNVLGVTLSKSLLIRNHQHRRAAIWYCKDMRAVEWAAPMADRIRWPQVKIQPPRILGKTNHPWRASRIAIANWIHLIQDLAAESTKFRKRRIALKIWRWRTCRAIQTHWTLKLVWVVARIES